MAASRESTLALVARLPEREILRPRTQDRWSVKDVLTHLLSCDEETLRRFRLIARGHGDRIRWFESMADADRFNARTVGRARKLSLRTVLRRMERTRADLITNLIINTDRRTYHLELRATETTYMASVSWVYPQDQLIALRQQNAAAAASAPIATGVDINALNFRYRIEGDTPPWRPLRAFDDGRQVFIEFPTRIAQGEMPPLWVIGAEGDGQLVNYRVQGNHMIVDRLFAAAELRLGQQHQQIVRIVRTDGRP